MSNILSWIMGRGRPKPVSEDRYLLELLLHPDRAVFTSELVDILDVSDQTVRNNMGDLAEEGKVEIHELDAGNIYMLTDDGLEYLRNLLRNDYD